MRRGIRSPRFWPSVQRGSLELRRRITWADRAEFERRRLAGQLARLERRSA